MIAWYCKTNLDGTCGWCRWGDADTGWPERCPPHAGWQHVVAFADPGPDFQPPTCEAVFALTEHDRFSFECPSLEELVRVVDAPVLWMRRTVAV